MLLCAQTCSVAADMQRRAFRITFPAIVAALAAIVLVAGSYLPSGQIGIAAIASLFPLAAVLELGWGAGLGSFIVSAILGLLLSGDRTVSVLYCAFCGWYPMVRFVIMRLPNALLCWVLRFAVLNAAVCTVLFLFNDVLKFTLPWDNRFIALIIVNAVFPVYELLISKISTWYVLRVSPKIKRG